MGGHQHASRLPALLARLQRRGGSVLVVGADGHRAVCRRFCGAGDDDHHRVVVSPIAGESSPGVVPADDDAMAVSDGRLLSTHARRALAKIDQCESGRSAGGTVRVCIEAVGRLLAATDREAASLFLRTVAERTRAVNGLVHAHLHTEYRRDPVRRLEPHVDAVVEVRADPTPRQRWRLPEDSTDTGWLPVRD